MNYPNKNLIGPQIRKIRYQKQMTQDQLAIRLQMAGFDLTRGSVAKIESRISKVKDYELFYFTRVLGVTLADLFPPIDQNKREMYETLDHLMKKRF